MKKIFFALLLVCGFFLQRADAQVRLGVNFNMGAQPDWGPYGYDNAQFYYFPDIDIYYDVLNSEFVYFDGYDWRSSPYLPSMYNDFDLYGAYKVVINEPRPYLRADYYRRQYYSYRGYHNQPVIRDYRNGFYNNERRAEHFEQRGERSEQREQAYGNDNRIDRSNDRSFDRRNNNYNNGFDQRNGTNNRSVYEQQDNNVNIGRNSIEQRGNENNGNGRMNGKDRSYGHRDEDRNFRRH